MNRVAIRNIAIVLGIAALVFVSETVFGALAGGITQIITVLFIAAIAYAAYRYFSQNQLAWYVIPKWQRYVLVACGVAVLALVIAGFPLLSDAITPLGVIALIAALVLVMVWIVRESRRL